MVIDEASSKNKKNCYEVEVTKDFLLTGLFRPVNKTSVNTGRYPGNERSGRLPSGASVTYVRVICVLCLACCMACTDAML